MPSLLVENAFVIAMTRPGDAVRGGALLVEDGMIAAMHAEALRRAREIEAAGHVVERLNADGLWLLPGFVQAHVHLCQTLLRNGPADLELLPWLRAHVLPGEAALDEEMLEVSARLGLAELLAGGTTSILDMGTVRHTDAIFRAAETSGMRVASGNALMDDPSTCPDNLRTTAEEGLAELRRLLAAWQGKGAGRLRVACCPRFALSCTEPLLKGAARLARDEGLLVHTHAAESRDEVRLVRERTGGRNVSYLDAIGLTGRHSVFAHVIHTDEEERATLARSGTAIAHCPSSNLKLGSGICPVPEYLRAGIRVGIGADGAPCNDRLDAFTEMRLAALLPRPRLGPAALSAFEVLRMATAEGAEAIGLPHVGTLEPGKRADLVLLDPDAGFARPVSAGEDPYGPIVFSFDRSHVVSTWVDGVPRYHRSAPVGVKLKPAAEEIESAACRLARLRGG